ncbi:MAG: beta-ketoacyl-ACP synthase III [Bdellovibrionia bacterium]
MNPSSLPFASRITGTGAAFPEKRLTNDDLSKLVETNDEWIRERTGITERRIARPDLNEAEKNSSLGAVAATRALEMAGKRAEDIDLILYATCTPDTLIPSTACWLQKKIGASKAWALDMNAACSGFVFSLATADSFIRSGQFKTALVVGGDLLSRFTNWDDRGSCILFGDGVGAMVVERTSATDQHRIYSSHLGSDGTLWDTFHIVAGGSNLPLTPELLEQRQDKMQMKGREMFKVAVKGLAEYAAIALENNGLTKDQLDWLVPHQANLRIIEAVAKRLEFPMEKVIVNIDRFGNTSSATVPTAFDEAVRDGRVKSGQTVLFDVFGAGLTYGSMLIRW